MKKFIFASLCSLALVSCSAPKSFYNDVYEQENKMTLGTIQKEIANGMSQTEVIAVLGSPNIVTKDENGKESWVYDKVSSEVKESGSSGLILFFSTGADYVRQKSRSQKTITLILKFNEEKKVENFSYHSSSF